VACGMHGFIPAMSGGGIYVRPDETPGSSFTAVADGLRGISVWMEGPIGHGVLVLREVGPDGRPGTEVARTRITGVDPYDMAVFGFDPRPSPPGTSTARATSPATAGPTSTTPSTSPPPTSAWLPNLPAAPRSASWPPARATGPSRARGPHRRSWSSPTRTSPAGGPGSTATGSPSSRPTAPSSAWPWGRGSTGSPSTTGPAPPPWSAD
jgi:hypothetical protein